jgi:hypothetical protein
VGIDPDDHCCSFLTGVLDREQRSACRLSDPAERDLICVEPDRYGSSIGEQNPGEPARSR